MRRRWTVRAAVVALALPLALGAEPASGAVQDGTGALSLVWDGTGTVTATDSFVGKPVAVPGDTASRSLVVRNDGPTAGTLRAWIVDVTIRDAAAPDHGNFYEDLTLHWETAGSAGGASFLDLAAAGTTSIGEVPLERGASTAITVTYELPWEATSGNRANVAPREASFDVRLEISGELPPVGPDAPDAPVDPDVPDAPVGPDVPDAPVGPDVPARDGALPATGFPAAPLLAVLAALVGAGCAIRASALRSPSRWRVPPASRRRWRPASAHRAPPR